MTRDKAKKELLSALLEILQRNDDIFPPDVDEGTPDYERLYAAREDLVTEFLRRIGS